MDDKSLREHIVNLLEGKGAHVDFTDAVEDFSPRLRGVTPAKLPHSAWQLVEHIRIAQWDILEFSRNPKHVSPPWPDGYWPKSAAPATASAWEKSISSFENDRKAMKKLVMSPKTDLFAKIPHGEGQTILREALLIADHNAYHVGQIVLVRRALGAWKG